jgi:hypothetical protein
MPFEFVCPHCHNRTKVLDRFAGQSGPCVACGKTVVMPHFNSQGVLVPSVVTSPTSSASTQARSPRGWTPALVSAGIVLFFMFLGATVVVFLWPTIRQNIERSAQGRDLDNMRSINLALNAYSDRYGTYPPPFAVDLQGKPLYSWRVLILPFMGYEDIYKQFDLRQPWDSVANTNLQRLMPSEFASPNSPDARSSHETNYVLITGAGTMFPPAGPISTKNIDRPTILLVETKNNTIWSAPGDIDMGRSFKVGNKPMVDVGGLHKNSFTAMTVEGESMRIPVSVPPSVLGALVTPNGGENVQTSTFIE